MACAERWVHTVLEHMGAPRPSYICQRPTEHTEKYTHSPGLGFGAAALRRSLFLSSFGVGICS